MENVVSSKWLWIRKDIEKKSGYVLDKSEEKGKNTIKKQLRDVEKGIDSIERQKKQKVIHKKLSACKTEKNFFYVLHKKPAELAGVWTVTSR